MAHVWHEWAIQDGPGWWINNSCHPTRHITEAKRWPTEQEATELAESLTRINGGKREFTVHKLTLSQPPLTTAGYPSRPTEIAS
jgi:hypothetical protein